MLNERRSAVQRVTADFRKAERAVDEAAMMAASCVATMIAERAAAKLPVTTGLDVIDRVMESAADLVRARRRLMETHAELVLVREGIGIRAYGDISECPDEKVSAVHLSVVA